MLDAADERFVGLDDPAQKVALVPLHRGADAVAEVPCRLVGHAERPLELVRAHALLGLAHEVGSEEPLPQGKVGVVEHRPGRDGESRPTVVAVELLAGRDPGDRVHPAVDAPNPIRPPQVFEIIAAPII